MMNTDEHENNFNDIHTLAPIERAVSPEFVTLVGSAPYSSNTFTTLKLPTLAAIIRGVTLGS